MAVAHEAEHKSFAQPEEARDFPNGRPEIPPSGHGARVVGDWYGASTYAKWQ